MKRKIKAEKRPARNALHIDDGKKLLTEMDSDEILSVYKHNFAGGDSKKRKEKVRVSGKSVFQLKALINRPKKS
ncbi:MAG: hypothetical protein COU40_00060 [Candidatus Moranbacteria bacterium CG10_big_fil_rev_8_21_14_0_10_35_21]|nr:MAG: hypothetical protein COU40_00060 [Candidatus Moranbacteria bacterium CG10_big_fil_rev_8_21_14_0_10_35_21]PJA88451.1 MAG: hypothetical protein CO139_03025 [Candidatus Moranbacteria bacterium CG_4_9_14_3_um_filter_36_9]